MRIVDQAAQRLAGLHWLAYLLTGNRDVSVDVAIESVDFEDEDNPSFSAWMDAWSRRVVIAKALAAIRRELAVSHERMKSARVGKTVLPGRDWVLGPSVGKAGIEKALLALDVFPRAALVLTVLEGMAVADAAVLLDGDTEEVLKARAIGLRELTVNLARPDGDRRQPSGAGIPQWAC